jgi:2-hydroxy-3-keto-5-methylthiopentenyl-1-phosphate phosphatase
LDASRRRDRVTGSMSGPGAVVFLDFDGTITIRDATDAILDAFADGAWLEIEEAWVAGKIGSRECLAAQMALVTASQDQIHHLLDTIGVDPGLGILLEVCAAGRVPVHIITDGFDYCIDRILRRPDRNFRAELSGSHIVSSSLHHDGGRWRAAFLHPKDPCRHGCATCKPAAMERLNADGAVTVFVGDGFSDRHAAKCADIVFAKDKLASFCEETSIPYAPFDTLTTVALGIKQLLGAGLPLPPPSGKVSRAS